MALTVTFDAPQGLSPVTLELYPFGSDTIANGAGGDAATEATNDKGRYSATVSETLSGYYHARVVYGGNTLSRGMIRVQTGATEVRVQDVSDDSKEVLDILQADRYIDTSVTPWALVLVRKGTGALGVGTELLRQQLKDETGANITDIGTFVGRSVSP